MMCDTTSAATMFDAALKYAQLGYPVFPCKRRDKAPFVRDGFKAATTDKKQVQQWWSEWPNAMIAIPTGPASGIDVLDIDVKLAEGIDGYKFVPNWQELSPLRSETPSGGTHVWFRSENKVRNSTSLIAPGVDTRGKGGYIIAPPSRGLDGAYRFRFDATKYLADRTQLPPFPADLLAKLGQRYEGWGGDTPTADPARIAAAMRVIPNPDLGWDDWKKSGMAIWRATGGSEEGFRIFDEWSEKSQKNDADNTQQAWEHITRSPPSRIGAGSIFYAAKKTDPNFDSKTIALSKTKQKQANLLVDTASELQLFHNAEGNAYADFAVGEHCETWPIRSKQFKGWLAQRFYEEYQTAPNSEAISTALNLIEAQAKFDGPQYEVYLRLAAFDDRVYLDLCNREWQVVEIDANGWRVVDYPPVRFIRRAGQLTLPVPIKGGSVKWLIEYLNIQSQNDFVLIVAWLLAALRPCGPYPLLVVTGEAGSAKSTLLRMLRVLIDPNTAPLRAPPPRRPRPVYCGQQFVCTNIRQSIVSA
jgi:Bifunctional DNA primase/polymerase, N-terminal/Primase C terminal 2 (PriCT-2)